jgi:serine/alanine adding enzyme
VAQGPGGEVEERMSTYWVELWDGRDQAAWDEYVLGHRHGRFFHLGGWKTVIEGAYGRPAYFWVCREGDRIAGVLPSAHLKHFLFGNSLVSLPYLDGGGILAKDSEVAKSLLEAVLDLAATKHIPKIEFRNLSVETSLDPRFTWQEERPPRFRMILPLPEKTETLFGSFPSILRRDIKRAGKKGLLFALGGKERLSDFYQVFAINMRDLGSPVHSLEFYRHIIGTFQDYCKIGMVYFGEKPIATAIFFFFHETCSGLWGSSLKSFRQLYPNMLLFWELMKYAISIGCKYFDFGRSYLDTGTYRFKEQWGAQPHLINWKYLYLNQRQGYGKGNREKYSQLIKIWQKLPVPVSKVIGPMIRKYIDL